MSKLYKLREWLTLADAAQHLAISFGEKVVEADVLRLTLDGHLTLSINFVNHAKGRCGKLVPISQARFAPLSSEKARKVAGTRQLPQGILINNEQVLEPTPKEPVTIDGVWDLPMVGNERIDVERYYQELTGGPAVELLSLAGTFVNRADGVWCAVQEWCEKRVPRSGP